VTVRFGISVVGFKVFSMDMSGFRNLNDVVLENSIGLKGQKVL
jgi:hypothetical protein